jgi:hypothetical protein
VYFASRTYHWDEDPSLTVRTKSGLNSAERERNPIPEDGVGRYEKLPPQEKGQALQLLDAFIERGQLKRKATGQAA